MELRHIEYFLTVAAEGSISRAAAELHMAQPPLSTAIARMERDLGVTLFERSSRGVRLTAPGRFLTEAGEELLRASREIERRLKDFGAGIEGQLTIASIPSLATGVLPPILARFVESAPRVDVGLRTVSPAGAIDALLSEKASVALMALGERHPLARELQGEFESKVFGTHRLIVMLPPRLRNMPDPVDLRELADEPWVVPFSSPRVPGMREVVEDIWRDHGLPRPGFREVSTMQTGIPLIEAGMGIGFLPRTRHYLQDPSMVARESLQRLPSMDLAVMWRSQRGLSPTVSRFIDLFDESDADRELL